MKHLILPFSLLLVFHAWGQDINSELSKFAPIIQALENFSKSIPQEKVYLHFDNTSYYQGDNIWFKCYVVTSGEHRLSQLSKTLYVELLNPGGEMVDKRILKIENGQCHGEFTMNQHPFYSGFYEVRAYTKYMLNFGDDVIFSRLLPVFDKPKVEGNFEEKEMLPYGRWGAGNYPMKRERPLKEKKVNLRFFPEGGNLIQGIASRVAFEATDEAGNPIDVNGTVMDCNKQELCAITTEHEGRGVFTYTPTGSVRRRDRDIVEVEYSGKRYRFDLPEALPQGIVMEVDNLSYPDSIGINLRKTADVPAEMLGMAVISGGKMQHYRFVWMEDEEISFTMNKSRLPAGVSQIVLFNSKGEILCDRLVFIFTNEFLKINVETGRAPSLPKPHELVNMEFTIADMDNNPFQATFSLSVRDGANEVENKHNILTDLLLMSEIKGYIRNPSYYFDVETGRAPSKNEIVETGRAPSKTDIKKTGHAPSLHLDLLLMVQGWRRYSWKQMSGIENFEMKYFPEQGIETTGKVFSFSYRGKQIPKPNVDVSLFLHQKGKEYDGENPDHFIESFVTDDQGGFAFVSDEISGKWNMVLGITEKGKKKNYQIVLDRVFSPEPGRYRYADLQISIAENNSPNISAEEIPEEIEDYFEAFLVAYQDSLSKFGIDKKVHQIPEVTIKAKRRTREQEVFQNRSTSIAYYDVAAEYDEIYDRGGYVGKDIHALLKNMNKNFSTKWSGNMEWILYKNKMPLIIIDYKPMTDHNRDYFRYKAINFNTIKNIYINETTDAICQYMDPRIICFGIQQFLSCVVFIETYPDGDIPVDDDKGIRKTWLEGYSTAKEFYSPNYSELPPAPDYRRTLYWNPMVTPDENGKAKINFYNNSRCTNFSISAETVSAVGGIGVFKQ